MNVVLLSMFSTSESYLPRYFRQTLSLSKSLKLNGHQLRLILCEGDSRDETWAALQGRVAECHLAAYLFQYHHKNRVYGSLENPTRFAQLSKIWNKMFEQVELSDDLAVLVESDLVWETSTMLRLIKRVEAMQDIVSPMIMQGDDFFRDVWAFRKDGRRFTNEPPFFPGLDEKLVRLDSAGSCLAMPADVLRTCRTTETEELVGLCSEARHQGYRIWLDPSLRIEHPSEVVSES